MINESMTPAEAFLERVDVAGRVVVDVGCGAGALVRELRERGALPLGVECGPVMMAQALAADSEHPADYIDAGGESLPIDDDAADVIVYSLSLHHVPTEQRSEAIKEAKRVLRPGGTLVVMEPLSEGPGHVVFAPIVDETVICREVQQLLSQLGDYGFTHVATASFTADWVYADVDDALADVVGVDPDRQAVLAERRAEVDALFRRHGVVTPAGVALAQPIKFDQFTAA